MAATVEIGTLISRTPGVCGGRPCVAGTRILVTPIAKMHNQGMTVEEIAASWEHISIAQVHAALAYYFANKVEVHAALEEEEREYERLAKQFPRQP